MLCREFPVVKHGTRHNHHEQGMASASSCFDDTRGGNETYGFLTWKGMHQMYHTGVAMADRYGPENSQNNGLLVRPGSSFRDLWDIEAFSTNYLRTVKSCQAFLDGLFNDHGSSSSSSSSGKIGDREALDYEPPTHYESIDDIAEYRRTRVDNSGGTNAVEIHVRDPKDETLNPWSSSPELMKNLMSDALETPESIENNRKAANLTRELSEYIPGLLKHSPTPTSGIKINWVSWYAEESTSSVCFLYPTTLVIYWDSNNTHTETSRSPRDWRLFIRKTMYSRSTRQTTSFAGRLIPSRSFGFART